MPARVQANDAGSVVAIDGADAHVVPGEAVAERHGIRVLAILSALMGFASISTDLYLPALPEMATSLHSDPGAMELTISGYLIGFSLGQLVWDPVGDCFGRRLPVAIGLVLFVIGSAGCAMSGTAAEMIGWRVVQAVGASAGVVLARAMVRDLYEGDRAARMMSTLMTVMAVAPLLGPIVGGQELNLWSWRAIFWTLVGVGGLTLLALLALPETLPASRRNREPLVRAFADYAKLMRQPRLLGFAGAGGFFYGAMFAYIAGTPSLTSASTTCRPSSTARCSGRESSASWRPTRSTRGSSPASAACACCGSEPRGRRPEPGSAASPALPDRSSCSSP